MLLNIAGIKKHLDDSSSSFDIEVTKQILIAKWNSLSQPFFDIETHTTNLLETTSILLNFSKWGFISVKYFK